MTFKKKNYFSVISGYVCFFMLYFFYNIFPLAFVLFYFLCTSAFEQGHLEPWRYRNASIIIIILLETASEQSDVEGRIRALNDDLQRRKREAERLKKEQRKEEKKQEHNKLKEQEQALKEQIEVDFL